MKCNFKLEEKVFVKMRPANVKMDEEYSPENPGCNMKRIATTCDGEKNCLFHISRLIETREVL